MTGIHRRRKRTTTNEQYAAMLARMFRALEGRIEADPKSGLGPLRDLEEIMSTSVNAALYRLARDGASPTKLADSFGVSRQAIYKRITAGEQVVREREKTAGRVPGLPRAVPRAIPPPTDADEQLPLRASG